MYIKRFYKIFFTLFSLLIFFLKLEAQENKLLRGEINSKEYDFVYFVPMAQNGLLTVQHSIKFRSSNDYWRINFYSKNLRKVNYKEFSTGPGHRLIEYYDDKDSLFYGFFADEGGSRKYEILKYNYVNGNISKFSSYGSNRLSYKFFDVVGSTEFVAGIKYPAAGAYFGQILFSLTLVPAIWGVKIYNEPALIFYHNGSTGKKGKIEIGLKGENIIFATKANSKSGIYSLIIKNIYRKKSTLHYYEFNNKGEETKHSLLSGLNSRNLLSGSLIILNDTTFAFVGTYNNDKNHRVNTTNPAYGVFVSTVVKGEESIVKFNPFSEFTNAKRALDFRDIKHFEERKKKGQDINLGFRLLMHKEIIQMDSVFVLLTESYYPEYHYETYNNYYGYMSNDQIFDGYRFTYAIAAAFNHEGDLVWDNIFNISEIISFNLDENVIVYFDGSTQVMLYYADGKIYSKVMSGNDIVYRKEKTEIQTIGGNEKVLYENYGHIYHWYGPYFLLTGYQQVVDDRGKRRKVYFFLKLKFG